MGIYSIQHWWPFLKANQFSDFSHKKRQVWGSLYNVMFLQLSFIDWTKIWFSCQKGKRPYCKNEYTLLSYKITLHFDIILIFCTSFDLAIPLLFLMHFLGSLLSWKVKFIFIFNFLADAWRWSMVVTEKSQNLIGLRENVLISTVNCI